jgi:hypothetical protein
MGTLVSRRATRILLAAGLVVSLAHDGLAQITTATISGTVQDETGAVLPGVALAVKNVGTSLTRSTMTDDNGYFTMPGLPPGRYEVRASLQGFTGVQSDITLAVAQQAAMNLTLKVSAASESITVTGTASLVDTQNAALSAVVTEKTIEQLPLNGRNYIDLALLQPGVTGFNEKDSTASSNRGTKFNVNGMGYRSNSYLIDGANMRGYAGTATVSAAETTLGVETIQEFRVVTNAYSADYGRAMGGVVSLVSKSGTNDLHGSGFGFFRDSAMDARNFFDGAEPPRFQRQQFGATIGGPVVRSKLFFFTGAERLQEDLGTTQVTTVPTEAARSGALGTVNPVVRPYLDLYPLPNGPQLSPSIGEHRYEFNQPTRENFYQGRVDYSLTNNDAFFGRYTYDGADQSVPVGFAEYGTDSVSRNQFFTVEYRRIFTPALLNTARFSHSRLRFEQLPVWPIQPDLAFVPDQDLIGTIAVGGLTTMGGTGNNPSTNNAFYWTFSDDVAYTKGRHLFKAGTLIEHVRTNKLTATNIRGAYTFNGLPQFLAGTASRFQGVLPGSNLERVRPNTLFGFYVQDDFRARSNLTLNLGLRYEFYTLPREADGLDTALLNIVTDTAFTPGALFAENPSLQNFAPRLGFAWDVTNDGRTAVRGGAGMYHDTDGTFNSAFGIAAFSPPFAAVTTINNPPFPDPPLTGTTALTARTLDYNIRQPYGITYNVSVQRELAGDMVVTVGYAGSRGEDLMSAVEGNPAVPQILEDGTKFFPPGTPRRNPAWGPIDYRTTGGRSWYNALLTSVQKRFSRRYQFQAAYTFGKAEDNTQAQLAADANNSSVFPQDPYDRDSDRARTDFDVRHVFTANFVWDLPGPAEHRLYGGWQLNGIVTLRSGVSFTPTIGGAGGAWTRSGNNAGQDRPNLRPGVNPDELILGGADRYFDPSGYVLQPQGFLGNAGRNSLTGPGYATSNLSLVKNTRLGFMGSDGSLQLRLEVFNVLNRANFAVPDRTVFAATRVGEDPLPTAGRLSRTITSARQLQLGVKLLF